MTAHPNHTPGPWIWRDCVLAPLVPNPDFSSVHTILACEHGAVGFLGSDVQTTLAEDAANRALIAAAPLLRDALERLLDAYEAAGGSHDDIAAVLARSALAGAQPGATG